MSFVQFLFGFQGRVRRLHFWLFFIVLGVIHGSVFWQFDHVWHVYRLHSFMDPGAMAWHDGGMNVMISSPFEDLFGVLSIWMSLAVTVKRWHDRDKSGWWVLISLIPVIGGIWQLIECGFLDGTPGPNKYGPSPKGMGAPQAAF